METIITCPNCQSAEVSKPGLSKAAMAIGLLLLGFPITFFSKVCHCFDCGRDFRLKTLREKDPGGV